MLNALILFILLFLTWIILSGFFGAFFIVSGIMSCVAAILISKKLGALPAKPYRLRCGFRFIGYFVWLIKEIIKSSWDVSIRMWQAEPNISPKLAWVPTVQKDDIGITMFANSITLTPGTVAVMAEEKQMLVHALCAKGIDDLVAGDMDRRIAKMRA